MGKRRADLHTTTWAKLRLAVLERDGWICQLCGCKLRPGGHATADHIIPHAMGGQSTMENLRAACNHCNSRRGARQARGHRIRAPFARVSRFG